ncbi:MAG TPA: hypothetical protein VK843_08100 [Planctomycetota bacterium]|nr:hypothetical protein [Planctomycetota bacterium]
MVDLRLTQRELALITEALDSHIYWQLSDEHYRSDGYVHEPGSDDADNAEQIVDTEALIRRVQSTLQSLTSGETS